MSGPAELKLSLLGSPGAAETPAAANQSGSDRDPATADAMSLSFNENVGPFGTLPEFTTLWRLVKVCQLVSKGEQGCCFYKPYVFHVGFLITIFIMMLVFGGEFTPSNSEIRALTPLKGAVWAFS